MRTILRTGWLVLVILGLAIMLLAYDSMGAWTEDTVLVSRDVIPDLEEAGLDAVITNLIDARGGRVDARTILNVVNDYLRDALGRPTIQMGVLEAYVTERIAAGGIMPLEAPAPADKRPPAPIGLKEGDAGWTAKPVEGATSYIWLLTATDDAGKVVTRVKVESEKPELTAEAAKEVFAEAEGATVFKVNVAAVTADGVGLFTKDPVPVEDAAVVEEPVIVEEPIGDVGVIEGLQ